jgi:hypothetical protein
MTGLRSIVAGDSFLTDAPIAGTMIDRSKSERDLAVIGSISSEQRVRPRHQEMLDDRSQRERGQERQRPDDQDGSDQQDDEQGA